MGSQTGNNKKVKIDEGLLARIADGEEEAFSKLYNLTYKPLFAFILSLTCNAEDAEDILQETYMRVIGSAHLYKPMGKPLSWMFKIAHNQVRGEWRKKSNVITKQFDEIEERIGFDNIKNIEDREMLKAAFKILSQEEMQIVTMHLIAGLKHREIAGILDLALSTVLSKYRRSLAKLKKKLKESESYEE